VNKLARIAPDERAASALEFALIAPAFFLFIFGIIELGLVFWTQVGLQHGAEMAARCASINTKLCLTNNPSTIATYATQQAYGLTLPASTFSYSVAACGNQVSATYSFEFVGLPNLGPLTLTAQSCFPS
jgi:Flp pilus assembly protein TadG